MHRNPDQPGPELRLAAKLSEMGKRARVGLLHHVLGLAVVLHDGPRRSKQPLIVATHDVLEQCRFAGQDAADERIVGIGRVHRWRGAQHGSSY
jgi:hypothetical protein